MQFKVPQNIDMEDKIVGPLTLVAFSELIFALMAAYLTWRYGNVAIFVIVGIPLIILGLAFAFVRPYEQPFSRFAFSAFQFVTRPKLRVWKKDPSLERLAVPAVINPVHEAQQQATLAEQIAHREETVSQLDKLARILDTQGDAGVAAMGGVTATTLDKGTATTTPKRVIVKVATETGK